MESPGCGVDTHDEAVSGKIVSPLLGRCGITVLSPGGKSSHATCEAVNKVSGGGTGCSQEQK